MIRTQIQLTAEQAKGVRAIARRKGRSMADVIRESVDSYLSISPRQRDVEDIRRDALSVVGKYRSGLRDLARKHDAYLATDLEK